MSTQCISNHVSRTVILTPHEASARLDLLISLRFRYPCCPGGALALSFIPCLYPAPAIDGPAAYQIRMSTMIILGIWVFKAFEDLLRTPFAALLGPGLAKRIVSSIRASGKRSVISRRSSNSASHIFDLVFDDLAATCLVFKAV